MTNQELKDILRESLGVELRPGTEMLVFIDQTSFDRAAAEDLMQENDLFKIPVQLIFLNVPQGKTVADCVATIEVPRAVTP